jgi:hypothetical protein
MFCYSGFMIERLRYDFDDKANPILDVPGSVFERAIESTKILEAVDSKYRLVVAEQGDGGVRLTHDMRQLKKIIGDNKGGSETAASYWYYVLWAIQSEVTDEVRDQDMWVEFSKGPLPDASGQQRRGMRAELRWPLPDARAAGLLATEVMQRSAVSSGYISKNIADSAYAIVADEQGVELQALDIGCCCLYSTGEPDVRDGLLELNGHNLYNRQVILTCLSGLVALARQHP